jgi:hypothetical protein
MIKIKKLEIILSDKDELIGEKYEITSENICR